MSSSDTLDSGLPPWQFFLLCGMLGATAVVVVATGQPIANVIVLSVTIVTASFVGLAAYRTLAPLVSRALGASPVVAGGRTRAALEREKTLVLRTIKELEFDFAMGKVSQADFDEMGGRLRRRAMGLIQQLDANTGYRDQIEREVAALLASKPQAPMTHDLESQAPGSQGPKTQDPRTQDPRPQDPGPRSLCPSCATANDTDARFCKQCGSSLAS